MQDARIIWENKTECSLSIMSTLKLIQHNTKFYISHDSDSILSNVKRYICRVTKPHTLEFNKLKKTSEKGSNSSLISHFKQKQLCKEIAFNLNILTFQTKITKEMFMLHSDKVSFDYFVLNQIFSEEK